MKTECQWSVVDRLVQACIYTCRVAARYGLQCTIETGVVVYHENSPSLRQKQVLWYIKGKWSCGLSQGNRCCGISKGNGLVVYQRETGVVYIIGKQVLWYIKGKWSCGLSKGNRCCGLSKGNGLLVYQRETGIVVYQREIGVVVYHRGKGPVCGRNIVLWVTIGNDPEVYHGKQVLFYIIFTTFNYRSALLDLPPGPTLWVII